MRLGILSLGLKVLSINQTAYLPPSRVKVPLKLNYSLSDPLGSSSEEERGGEDLALGESPCLVWLVVRSSAATSITTWQQNLPDSILTLDRPVF